MPLRSCFLLISALCCRLPTKWFLIYLSWLLIYLWWFLIYRLIYHVVAMCKSCVKASLSQRLSPDRCIMLLPLLYARPLSQMESANMFWSVKEHLSLDCYHCSEALIALSMMGLAPGSDMIFGFRHRKLGRQKVIDIYRCILNSYPINSKTILWVILNCPTKNLIPIRFLGVIFCPKTANPHNMIQNYPA